MKQNSYKICYLFVLIMVVFLLSACTKLLKISKVPPLQSGSPLSGIDSKTFAFKEFEDIRKIKDPRLIIRLPCGKHMLEDHPATLIAGKIKDELQRNGHVCIKYEPHAKADFIVEGSIDKYQVEFIHVGNMAVTYAGHAVIKLTIRKIPPETGVFVKSYQGKYQVSTCSDKGVRIALVQSTLIMIKEISTDMELIDFIQKQRTTDIANK